MMDIKDIQGNIILSVSISQECERVEELMKSDYIQLSWNSNSRDVLPAGRYIEYKGEKYSLLEPYSPTQKDEVEFTYQPQFQSKIMIWGKTPFFMYTYANGTITNREPDWNLTDNPANFMSVVVDAIKNETGDIWTYSVGESLPASASLSFQSIDIFSALNQIANAFETEWWVDKINKVIHLSKASHGDAVLLEVDRNVNTPSVTSSKEGYYTRFYAFGSTRNIVQDYKGANVNNLVNKRLTLDPVKYPGGYKDIHDNLSSDEIFSKVLIFDDIYPSSKLKISDVRVRLMWTLDSEGNKVQVGTNEDGEPIYDQYAIWYFQIADFTFNNTTYDKDTNPQGMLISGKTLSVHFQDGSLSGREFELNYHDKSETVSSADGSPVQIKEGDYEILFVKEGSLVIPMISNLVPADGNEIILFNIRMPEEYTASAYLDLESALDKEMERMSSDLNNYQFSSNPVVFKSDNPNLSLGRKVTYKNGNYSYSTRVIKLVTRLDYDTEQTITVGNEQIKGNTQEIKEEVASANKDINLLAILNSTTNSLTQAYNRTQQLMLEGFASIKDMWRFDPNNDNTIFSKYNVYSEKAVSAKGFAPGSGGGSGEGGATALYQLNDVAKNDSETNVLGAAPGKVLTYGTDGKWYAADAVGLDETALSKYLTDNEYTTRTWVSEQLGNYTTTTDLTTLLGTKVDKVEGKGLSTNDFTTALLEKLNSIEQGANKYILPVAKAAILGGVMIGSTLTASATGILNLPEVTTAGTYTKVTTDIYGRVTSGSSLSAGDIPALSISKITGLQDALNEKVNKSDFNTEFDKAMQRWFVRDVNGKAIYPAAYSGNEIGFYSKSFISAMGLNPNAGGGGGGGLIESVYGYADLGKTFSDSNLNDTFNAYTVNRLASRITSLENSSITEVPWGIITNKPSTLGGYGITDALSKTGTAADSSKLGGFTPASYDYVSAYNFTTGCLVKTNISASSPAMCFVHIIGNGYASLREIDTTLQFYNYPDGNSIINISATNYGLDFGDISVFNYDGVVYIWFKQTGAFQTFFVYVHYNYGICNRVTSITNASKPTSGITRQVTVTPKDIALTTSNVASATKLATARSINGTDFDGTANITTATWGTARSIGIVNSDGTGTAVTTSVNGGANVNLKLPSTIKANLSGNATSAGYSKALESAGSTTNINNPTFYDGYRLVLNSCDSDATNQPVITSNACAVLTINKGMHATSGYYINQIFFSSNEDLYTRVSNAGSFTAWRRILTSGNYNNYAPSLTGTGASGTWGINVTGNSGSATKLQTARTLWGQSFNGTVSISGNLTGVGNIVFGSNNTYTIGSTTALAKGVYSRFLSSTDNLYINSGSGYPILFQEAGTERMRMTGSGSLGIGTTSPSEKLHVAGNITANILKSTIATGTAPLTVASSTKVTNLNADLLDGQHLTHVTERTYAGTSASGTKTGWFRIGETLATDASGCHFILFVFRNYSYLDNESYTISVNITYGGYAAINQISGYSNVERTASSPLLDKIRITGNSSGTYYVDIHIAWSTTTNQYYWSAVGALKTYDTWKTEADDNITTLNNTFEAKLTTGICNNIKAATNKSYFIRNYVPALSVGYHSGISFGRESSNYNNAYVGFRYAGSGSTSNGLNFGMYGADNLMFLNGLGNLGIGTITPSYKLHVVGSAYFSERVTFPKAIVLTNSTSTAYNSENIRFGNNHEARIGIDTAAGMALYAKGSIYLRPGSISASSGLGLEVKASGDVSISGNITNATYTLANSSTNPYLKLVHGGINWYLQAYSNTYIYLGAGTTNSLRIDNQGNTYTPGTFNAKVGIWSDGYVSAKGQNTTSDMRLKNKGRDIFLTIKDIANAPAFEYTWKDGTPGVMVGSSAQYWRGINENFAPLGPDRRHFEMMYGNLGVVLGISLARHFETLEERVKRLEKENLELREFKRKVEQRLSA